VTHAELIDAARRAAELAYAPYSNFRVGAAALTGNGEIVTGCNVENAAYSQTICAERVAVFSAFARGRRDIVAVAIVTPSGATCRPCGTCRQVFSEIAPNADIVLEDGRGGILVERVAELLPKAFGPANLASESPVKA